MTASAVNLGHDVAAADRLEPATLENGGRPERMKDRRRERVVRVHNPHHRRQRR
jgi:hypothetical protein